MLIKKIEIEKFRGFNHTTITLGTALTIIAGQNGTGKSTILGMLGQPFSCTIPAYLKTSFGLSAKTEFSDIFKFSPDKDIPGEHLYFLFPDDPTIHPDGQAIQIKSYKRSEGENGVKDPNHPSTFIRLVTGKKRGKKEAGGNINDVPVVYLGLGRLQPLGEAKGLVPGAQISSRDEQVLIRKHKQILKLNHITAQEESIHSLNSENQNRHWGYRNQEYDEYANSAGQDNVNKILISTIFLEKIKALLGQKYKGGLSLIDEIDATLFPASQEALVDELIKFSKKNNIQTIVTTHSLNLLKHININYHSSSAVTTVFLRNKKTEQGFVIEAKENPSWQFIENNLEVIRNDQKNIKIHVFREDNVTEFFIKKILGRKILSCLHFEQLDVGYPELKKLSNYHIPLFQQGVFVVDGEVSDEALSQMAHAIRLPGQERPEKLLYKFIKSLPDEATCWDAETGKTSQQCFQNFGHENQAKEWFNQLSSKDKSLFLNLWKKNIPAEIKDFKKQFIELYNKQATLVGAPAL